MLSLYEFPAITAEEVNSVDFFHDFILFLKRINHEPIKKTSAGNISIKNISDLLPEMKSMQDRIREYKEIGRTPRGQDDLPFLLQIEVIAKVMGLIFSRKGEILLTKKGKDFLKNQTPVEQYEQTVLHFWYRVNWDFFSITDRIDNISLAELLQQKQDLFWELFLKKGTGWIDYVSFCRLTADYFQLHKYFTRWENPDSVHFQYLDFELVFFTRNLQLFGCAETEKIAGKYEWQKDLSRFRMTKLGLHMFYKALHEKFA